MKIKIFKRIKLLFFLLIALALAIISSSFSTKKNLEKKCDLVTEKLTTISELATVKYNYSNVISIKDSLKYKDFVIPFTEKSFVVKYNGYITAGIDLSQAKTYIENNELSILLPSSKILNHTVSEDEIYVFDEKSSAFNKLHINDMLNEIVSEKSAMEDKLVKEGFLDKVNNDTIKFLQDFFKELDYDEIKITIDK
ncbi:hypothetical protein J2Z44_001077 [Clostridium punense]|uniref:DUF4230 domain-containing protein n=1 Tax=Clostridium punense TaxID=1054297 RepID=A0ABS4K2C7_9CLOT|nr:MULTISPECIES: DUF4230 domain-containing protein [Clostridium]MBP2021286.1 hypothetical protein [Clostridium punense]